MQSSNSGSCIVRTIVFTAVIVLLSTVARAQQLHWYRGNTHTHTINSDGNAAPDTVVRWYREHDYQFLFLTDHEYITDVSPLNALFAAKDQFLILLGQEITHWSEDKRHPAAHVNALFVSNVVFPVVTCPHFPHGDVTS